MHTDLFDAVMQLDLEPIKMKLMHVASGEGWSLEKANAVEKEYRRFLCLIKMYPDEDMAPLVDVDTFWHYHILDTMKYAADCERVFGYFLHHYPYVGMRGGDDEQFRLDSGNRMRELYEATFGDAYPGAAAAAEQVLDGAATAFCASPHGQDLAFCASPHTRANGTRRDAAPKADSAFCASPHGQDLAFCASPHTRADGTRRDAAPKADTAFCASPHGKDVAFCASPHTRADGTRRNAAPKADTAFCASPHGQDLAFCASPHTRADGTRRDAALKADTAFCASPHVTGEAAANA